MKKQSKQKPEMENLAINDTLPHQINAPSFEGTGIEIEPPFINSYGVTIGDSKYASPNSPLENWSVDTDPEIMSGDEWVHPTNDIGWNSAENREMVESNKKPQGFPFMHPTIDVSHGKD